MSADDDFPLGGITELITLPLEIVGAAVLKLTSCEHTHVFIVDRSGMHTLPTYARLGLSDSGLRCISEVINDASHQSATT
jgi:hypothetical protein